MINKDLNGNALQLPTPVPAPSSWQEVSVTIVTNNITGNNNTAYKYFPTSVRGN